MKKVRRVIALVGVIALVALYVVTLILAITDSAQTMNLFWAALVSTVILPVLIWAYTFIYNLLKKNYSEEAREREEQIKQAMKEEKKQKKEKQ